MSEKFRQFADKKREYFIRLGVSAIEAFKLHKTAGLWEKEDGKGSWRNVSEHCLVEMARVNVLADKLNLPPDIKADLATAAALHDFSKKKEKEMLESEGLAWESYEKVSLEAAQQIDAAGFNERIIRLVSSVGHSSLQETERILSQPLLTDEDIAYLIMHYVDDYTTGSDWVSSAQSTEGGGQINDLDRRVDKSDSNPRYAKLKEEGRQRFAGRTTFEAQREIGHLVEQRLADLVAQKTDQIVAAKVLPELIDQEIKTRITSL